MMPPTTRNNNNNNPGGKSNTGKIMVGPGLAMQRVAGGTLISLLENKAIATLEDCSGGTTKELAHVQATQDIDTYNRDTDGCPVSVAVITDFEFTADYKLAYRTRTLTFDKGGNLISISAESDLVVVTTAEECVTA